MNTVELIGHYGGDETHALSAWTSTSRQVTIEKLVRRPKLLKFLAENGHHTPFEKSYLHFLVTCDTASHIHLLKHRVGVSVNGESARYKAHKEERWHVPTDWPIEWQNRLDKYSKDAFAMYHNALKELEPVVGRKRAKESARFFLPYSHQITLDVGFNFRSFMHFCGLRHKEDAQEEIWWIAERMLADVEALYTFNESLTAFGYLV